MTLIAAIPSESGFLFAADTRETVGDLRQPVRKLNAIPVGRRGVLLYGGAGDADLLDDFEELLRRALLKSRPGSLHEVADLIERRLRSFYRSEIGDPQDVSFVPLFGVSLPAKRACGAWIARRKRLLALRSWELLGLDYLFYKHVLRRLLPAKPTVAQAMLTALHVFETAGSTSTGIETVPDVFFFNADGAWREKPVHVRAIQTSLLVYERQLNDVFLACADTTVSTEQVKQQIEVFKNAAVGLHRAHIKATAERMFTHGANLPSDPLPRVPLGSVISVGPGVHVWEPEQLEEAKPGFVPKVKSEALAEMDRMVDDEASEG
jgi:hypothetical protein